MQGCSKCLPQLELTSKGYIEFQSNEALILSIAEKLANLSIVIDIQKLNIRFQYNSFEELEQILYEVEILFNHEALNGITCRWEDLAHPVNHLSVPFSEFYERVKHRDLLEIINKRKFTSFLQPIVSLETAGIYGYEFLLRPIEAQYHFQPGKLFAFSQRTGMQSVLDSQARISSIERSKMLPKGIKRFINFLPSSIYDPNHCLRSTFQAVEKHNIDPSDLIFEVVETEKISHMNHLKNILDVYKKHGVKVALDDLGAGYATMEVLKELKPNFAKIDRMTIENCHLDSEKQRRLKEIVRIADDYGIFMLAEGIEKKEEAQFCHSIGIPLGQGYFFGAPQENPI